MKKLLLSRAAAPVAVILSACIFPAFAASIHVDATESAGEVSPWLYGDNQLGYDPVGIFGGQSIDDYSNYGAGLWNPDARQSVPRVIELARDRGVSVSRFPGGCGAHTYNWKQTIGPVKDRPHWQFGIDEFLQTCREMDAEPIITMSYFTGGPQDCADLVEYLNAPTDDDHPWAVQRAANGHADPYGVVYFEYGNEAFHTADHKGLVDPREYAARFAATAKAVKAVDPAVKLGAVAFNDFPMSAWNRIVFEETKDHVDFIIEHTYPVNVDAFEKASEHSVEYIFQCALAAPEQVRRKFKRLDGHVRKRTGRNDLRFAVTEYNGALLGDNPVPLRHCLGNALNIAETLRVFMMPESNVFMANYWQFINEYFGSIKGPLKGAPGEPEDYTLRPNYLVLWMYYNHFGSVLLPARVECGVYETEGGCGTLPAKGEGREEAEILSEDLLAGSTWTFTEFDGADVRREDGVFTLTFQPEVGQDYRNARTVIEGVKPNTTYRISAEVKYGRDIWGIKIMLGDGRGPEAGNPPTSTFWPLPHKGIWTEQHADYTTAADADSLEVALFRAAEEGTVVVKPGIDEPETIQVRNIEVREALPETLPAVPYLSVNASKSPDGLKVYLMVVNKNFDEAITAPVTIEGFEPRTLRAAVLNGPSIGATNEENPNNVKVTEHEPRDVTNGFEYTFEPHSMTALELSL